MNEKLDFDPTESAGFLVGRVAHALRTQVQRFLDTAGIDASAEEISILTVLAHLPEPEPMKSLAGKLGRDTTTVSRQIGRLEAAGFVKRIRSGEDGRSNTALITSAGEKLVSRTIPLTLELRARAMEGISKRDASVLTKSLLRMLQNLDDRPT